MRLTVLRMLSTDSLSAFSHAATARVDRFGPVQAARDRAPVQALAPAHAMQHQAMQQATTALPGTVPQRPLPRGSLLNISV